MLELRAVVKLDAAVRRQLRLLVADSGIKQEAIAISVGKGQSWLNKYLKGKRGATLPDLAALSEYFGRPLSSVLKDAEEGRRRRLSRDERWIALGRALDAADRRHFEALIRKILKAKAR